MQKVIAYSLFGTRPFYWSFLPTLLRAHHNLFPGWEIRVYHDSGIWNSCGRFLRYAAKEGLVQTIFAEEPRSLGRSMLWRTKPIWDQNVDFTFCRDIDSIPLPRERHLMEEFLTSGAAVHCISDHPAHTAPMMGGLCGFRNAEFLRAVDISDWETFIRLAGSGDELAFYGNDQRFLAKQIWPRIKHSALEHRRTSCVPPSDPSFSNPPVDFQLVDVPADLIAPAQRLWFHLGAAGYPVDQAIKLFDDKGNPSVRDRIQAVEIKVAQDRTGAPTVVLASDWNPDYRFLLPLTSRIWKKLGFRPICLLVGDPESWIGSAIVAELRRLDADVHFIPPLEQYETSTVAQVSRLYSAALGLPDDTYCLTSDADMWPAAEEFWKPSRQAFDIWRFKGNARNHICYIGGTVRSWRKLMQLDQNPCSRQSTDDWLSQLIKTELRRGLGLNPPSHQAWVYDEDLLNRCLGQFPEYPDRCAIHERSLQPDGLPDGRLDRAVWSFTAAPNHLIDVHLPRLAWTDSIWPRLRQLFFTLLPDEISWADAYHAEFCETLERSGSREEFG